MKKSIIPVALVCLLASCKKDVADTSIKAIQFSVFKSSNYSFPDLDNSNTETQLSISKTSRVTGQTVLVWDTVYSKRPFAMYPAREAAYTVEKSITGVKDDEFEVKASYLMKYTFEGSTIPAKQFTDTVRYERLATRAAVDVNLFRIDM